MTNRVFVITISPMEWDELKRKANLTKHGLDFADVGCVLENPFRLDVDVIRNQEHRVQSFAYVFSHLAVLTVVHTDNSKRIISFRRAGREEREVYHEWLANEFK